MEEGAEDQVRILKFDSLYDSSSGDTYIPTLSRQFPLFFSLVTRYNLFRKMAKQTTAFSMGQTGQRLPFL